MNCKGSTWAGGRMRADTGNRYRPVLCRCPLGGERRWGTTRRPSWCGTHYCQMVTA